MRRGMVRAVLVVAVLAVVVSLMGGCSCSQPGVAGKSTAGPTLSEFLKSTAKTGEFTVTSLDETGKQTFEATGTVWVDGRKFRYSLWVDGKLLRNIQSPDGKTAYFVQEATKISEPSVASVDRYLLEYAQPAATSHEDGIDKATGATRVVYSVKKLDDLAGAANAWYTEDVTYLIKDGKVIGVETRGDSPNKDGSPYDLSTSRRIFTKLTVGEPIPASVFELPYPIKAAK